CELRRLSTNLLTTQDEERRRIARQLHDGLGQDLAAAKMALEGLPQQQAAGRPRGEVIAEVSALIDDAIQQVRSISHLLHPPLLDEVGLQSALQWYLDGITKRSGIQTHIDVQPADFPRLAPELETALFRIVQEALTNIYRHSGARTAWVTLVLGNGEITGTVRDDGKGLSSQTAEFQPDSIGVGIAGMRQRVKELGGELRLRNADPGAVLALSIPIGSPAARYPIPAAIS
ncbi:MAG: sensor histidine kinase, partial [Terriglobia bacterium]